MEITRILLIDDEEDIRTIGAMSLREVGGWRVDCAAGGAEGIAQAAAAAPDLILLDVMMPELDGPTVLALLRADPATAATPVVFMTAKVQPSEVERYRAQGAAGVISKPFDPMTLPDEVRRIVHAL